MRLRSSAPCHVRGRPLGHVDPRGLPASRHHFERVRAHGLGLDQSQVGHTHRGELTPNVRGPGVRVGLAGERTGGWRRAPRPPSVHLTR